MWKKKKIKFSRTWCDEQHYEQQNRGPQLPGLPYGLKFHSGRLTVHFGGGSGGNAFDGFGF